MEHEMWEKAELITEWNSNDLRYKLFSIPRDAIDENSDENAAYLVIGIDNGGVRRIFELLDTAYGRITKESEIFIVDLLKTDMPVEAREILAEII